MGCHTYLAQNRARDHCSEQTLALPVAQGQYMVLFKDTPPGMGAGAGRGET